MNAEKKSIFSIHQVTLYNRTSKEFIGTLEVLEGSQLALEGELVELRGGSNKFTWQVEEANINSDVSLQFSEYPAWLLEILWGASIATNAAEANGSVSALTNATGASIFEAATGIATITALAGSEENMKFAKYVVKGTSVPGEVDLYMSTNIDADRGVAVTINDLLLVEAGITITSAATTDLTDLGLQITGGSGIIAMTEDDTMTFKVRPPNSGSETVRVGQKGASFPEFGMIVLAQKSGSLEITEFDCFKCKAAGLPVGMTRAQFSQGEVTVKMQYDPTENAVFEMTRVDEV